MLGAGADLVDAADVPTEMMMAGRVGAREGDHVMVAAVDAVQERDVVAGMIRQPHPEDARVKFDALAHVAREDQHVRETAGTGAPDAGVRLGAPRWPGPPLGWSNVDFSFGEVFAAALISIGMPS